MEDSLPGLLGCKISRGAPDIFFFVMNTLTITGLFQEQLDSLHESLVNFFNDNLKLLLIYGSRARCEWVGSSDLDLLIGLESAPNSKCREKNLIPLILDLENQFKIEINYSVLTLEEICRPSSLCFEITNGAIVLRDVWQVYPFLKSSVISLIQTGIIEKKYNQGLSYWRIHDETEARRRLSQAWENQDGKSDVLLHPG